MIQGSLLLREKQIDFLSWLFLVGRIDQLQRRDHERTVVRGDPIEPLEPTTKALVNDYLFAGRPLKKTDRCHQGTTVGCPIAGSLAVHVERIETDRAVIPMTST